MIIFLLRSRVKWSKNLQLLVSLVLHKWAFTLGGKEQALKKARKKVWKISFPLCRGKYWKAVILLERFSCRLKVNGSNATDVDILVIQTPICYVSNNSYLSKSRRRNLLCFRSPPWMLEFCKKVHWLCKSSRLISLQLAFYVKNHKKIKFVFVCTVCMGSRNWT